MALRQLRLAQGLQNRLRMAQQPQLVGHGALALAQEPGGLLLAHVELPHKPGNPLGFLHEVQVLPLEILHHGRHARLPVIHLHQDAGHIRQPRHLSCPQPPLPADQLVAALPAPDGQGLENSVAENGFGKFLQCFLPEYPPGLGRIGADGADG